MKRIVQKMFVVACLLLFGNFIMVTQEAKGENNKPNSIHFRKTKRENTDRPRSPSRQYIEGYYSDGKIYIMFAIPEGEATLSIRDVQNQEIVRCIFDTSSPLIYYIGEDVELGDYLEIVTSNGNIYEGFF